MRRVVLPLLLGLAPAVLGAQAAPPAAAPPPSPSPTPVPLAVEAPPTPTEAYAYQPEGRRDPFLSLLAGGTDARRIPLRPGEGPASLSVAEISVRGVLQSRGALIAMIAGPDNRTFIIHNGEKLHDGVVKTITPQGLVIVQEVNDPLSLIKQREVRKLLRSLEDAK